MRLRLKILFGMKVFPIIKKNWKNLLGDEGWMPPPPPIGRFNKPMTDQALLNSLVSAAENGEFMIHINYQELHQFRVVFSTRSG